MTKELFFNMRNVTLKNKVKELYREAQESVFNVHTAELTLDCFQNSWF